MKWLNSRHEAIVFLHLKKSLHRHAFLLAIIVLYAATSVIIAHLYNVSDKTSLALYSNTLGLMDAIFLYFFVVGYALYVMIRIRPEKLFSYCFNDLRHNYLTVERLLMALPVLFLFPLHFTACTSFKTILPDLNPFAWDPIFVQCDLVLHGDKLPWQWLQPALGQPIVTSTINFFYHLWFFVMFAILYWQAFSLRFPRLRMRFLLSFISIWILLGTIGAISLSSAGPCYYGRVTGLNDPFKPLMNYLYTAHDQIPVPALKIQEMLWKTYRRHGFGPGTGISAMPSIHVATSSLFALLGWYWGRLMGWGLIRWGLGVFAAIILVGSIHLGWHYAIDGYVAIIGTWLIWRWAGWMVRRYPKLFGFDSPPANQNL